MEHPSGGQPVNVVADAGLSAARKWLLGVLATCLTGGVVGSVSHYVTLIDNHTGRITATETELKGVSHQLDRIDGKLDRLVERQGLPGTAARK